MGESQNLGIWGLIIGLLLLFGLAAGGWFAWQRRANVENERAKQEAKIRAFTEMGRDMGPRIFAMFDVAAGPGLVDGEGMARKTLKKLQNMTSMVDRLHEEMEFTTVRSSTLSRFHWRVEILSALLHLYLDEGDEISAVPSEGSSEAGDADLDEVLALLRTRVVQPMWEDDSSGSFLKLWKEATSSSEAYGRLGSSIRDAFDRFPVPIVKSMIEALDLEAGLSGVAEQREPLEQVIARSAGSLSWIRTRLQEEASRYRESLTEIEAALAIAYLAQGRRSEAKMAFEKVSEEELTNATLHEIAKRVLEPLFEELPPDATPEAVRKAFWVKWREQRKQ